MKVESRMRAVRILSVCGSGTVSSAMLSSKLENLLAEHGYDMESTEIAPDALEVAVSTGKYDLIACTSPVKDSYGIPVLNATGFLVGINEEEFVEEFMETLGRLNLESPV